MELGTTIIMARFTPLVDKFALMAQTVPNYNVNQSITQCLHTSTIMATVPTMIHPFNHRVWCGLTTKK